MRDSEIVASIVAGEADGLAEAYDRYADALFGYCRSLLREPADAADAVQDTFVIAASRVAGLRDPELLRPWLYAVARNECLRRLGSREVAAALDDAPETDEHADDTADVSAEAERAETRALLRAALGGLNPAERDAVTQFLHGLDVAEIALVLDVSRNHVHALLSRARDQLEASVGVLLVARSGREECPELDALLAGWDGELTVLLRKRVARHIDRCDICSGRRRQVLSPAMLLGLSPGVLLGAFAMRAAGGAGGAGGAVRAAPAGLRDKALHMATGKDLPAQAYRGALSRSHPSFRSSGFPKPLPSGHAGLLRSPRVQLGAAVGAAAVIVAAVVLATSGGPGPGRAVGGGPLPGRGSAGQPPSGTPGISAGATPSGGVSRGGSGGRSGVPGSLASVSASSGAPSASPGASRTPSAGPSGTGSPSPSASATGPTPTVSPTGSRSPSATPTPTGQPAAGTLSVTPTSIVLTPLLGSTLTLTADGGPVNWSISEPASLLGELDVSPSSGTLRAGQSTQVTITVSGLASLDTQLTVSPGGQAVTVVLGLV